MVKLLIFIIVMFLLNSTVLSNVDSSKSKTAMCKGLLNALKARISIDVAFETVLGL